MRGRIGPSLLMFTFNAEGMSVFKAAFTDVSTAELTGAHGSWSSTDVTESDDVSHDASLPEEY
jgi:hypothetical protein